MAAELHVGDEGTELRLLASDNGTVTDLSDATTKEIRLQPPGDAVEITKTAAFVTDGTDGLLEYIVESGVLSVAGQWRVRSRVVAPSGTWSSSEAVVQVAEVF